MISRIKKIMDEENMQSGKFAAEIGISGSRLSHYMSGRNEVTLELVTRILERFRGISPEWLMFGRGEMYKTADSKIVKTEPDLFTQTAPSVVTDEKSNFSDEVSTDAEIFDSKPLETSENSLHETMQQPINEIGNTLKNKVSGHKSIEKILVLYSDSSFDCYLPNGHRL
ncbi:MAG: helix-turn-helix transcriptional regulator [Bacteroidales bacterium]|nr:helix-turn-helix transcriptional regulator [Bacteroidales bacterium]